MRDLSGLDDLTLRADIAKTPAHQKHALNVLRDGSFIESKTHKKYDVTKTTTCKYCGLEDSLECSAYVEVHATHREACEEWRQVSKTLREHLLPSRNPWEADFRRKVHEHEHAVHYDLTGMEGGGDLHLFTDGSAIMPGTPDTAMATWAVVSATEEKLVASSPLSGPNQTNDRAELEAVLHAVKIAARLRRPTTIWTDSGMVGQGVEQLLTDGRTTPDYKYQEVWMQLQEVLNSLETELRIQHIAAHRSYNNLNQDVDDWTALWNNRADWEARAAHHKRDPELQRVWELMMRHQSEQLQRLRRLRDLRWEIVETYKQLPEVEDYHDQEEDNEDDDVEDWISKLWRERQDLEGEPIQDLPQVSCQTLLDGGRLTWKYGASFPRQVFQIMAEQNLDEGGQTVRMSWLEVTVGIMLKCGINLPTPGDVGKTWVDCQSSDYAGRLRQPTVAACLRLTKDFFATWAKESNFLVPKVQGLNLACVRVSQPLQGTVMRIAWPFYCSSARAMESFTSGRPIRKANDLTRPLR